MPFGSRRGKVEASPFAMRVLSRPYATMSDSLPSNSLQNGLDRVENIGVKRVASV
jgi:hypothetical protein